MGELHGNSKIENRQSEILIVLVGPTAVGKTRLALRLAQEFDGEIVSADSRQVYRGMDIGTAKPTLEERRRVPHHLIDVLAPDETFTLAQYQELAYQAIGDILARGRVPFLVGGTGQYVRAVVEGWGIPRIPPNEKLRAKLYRQAEAEGEEALHARLWEVDPAAAQRIDPHNVRRVIRALEVYLETGQPISELQRKKPPPYRILHIGLTMERQELYRRIDQRVDRMIEEGLVEEVRRLVERGYGYDLPSMSGLGYQQIGLYLRGLVSMEEAVQLIKRHTRRFVRHQYNWFRLDDANTHWFDALGDSYREIRELVVLLLLYRRPKAR
ncbi:MAG: tRNA (adenosine(37)-N6)-dimethylallyltransferase MiaA [Chloroflexi bacterium]|nr:tRNA (adenosine(37)-N6)-dimethylallyltransferase MiaA [Chloroflexota bacterium]